MKAMRKLMNWPASAPKRLADNLPRITCPDNMNVTPPRDARMLERTD